MIPELKSFDNNCYRCLVVDPPWQYRNKKTGGSMNSGSADKYPTLTNDEISLMDIPSICADNAVLFLWATTPFVIDSTATIVMRNWGFEPKTAIYWYKNGHLGMGYWFRGQVEVCLVGIRGKVPAFRCQKPNIIVSKPRNHSQKPEEFFHLIEPVIEQHNLNPKIELFARERRPGWDCWGNQILQF